MALNSSNTPSVNYTRGLDLSSTLEGAGGIGGLLLRSHGYSSGSWSTHPPSLMVGAGSQWFCRESGSMGCGTGDRSFGGAGSYYFADGNGKVTYLIDHQNQAMVAEYRCDPFGRTTYSNGSLAGANLYRFYDPNVQRWIHHWQQRTPIL